MNKYNQIHPDEGIRILLDLDVDLKTEKVPVKDALNRVISDRITAKFDVPNFDKSPYDGYSIRGEDTQNATRENPVILKIIEEIPAGHYPQKNIQKGEAAKILTGGAVPKGANVNLKFEETEFDENYVKIFSPIEPNKDIIKAGEDTKKGSILVEQGDVLTPGVLGQISSQGIEFVNVYKKPLIGIGVTGSELLNSKEELTPGKIFETNSITFKGIFQNLGFEVKIYDIIPDEEEKIKKIIDESIDEVDILVTTGGASVGDYDYAVSTLQDLGGEVLFWKTAMKPGGSIVASRYKNKTILGLSGNPGAAILGMYRVCLPYLKKLLGRRELFSKTIDVILKEDVNKKSPRVRILRGYLEFINGKVYFAEKSFQGNGILSSFIECDCFAEIPAGSYEVKAGTILKAYRVGSIFGSIGE